MYIYQGVFTTKTLKDIWSHKIQKYSSQINKDHSLKANNAHAIVPDCALTYILERM